MTDERTITPGDSAEEIAMLNHTEKIGRTVVKLDQKERALANSLLPWVTEFPEEAAYYIVRCVNDLRVTLLKLAATRTQALEWKASLDDVLSSDWHRYQHELEAIVSAADRLSLGDPSTGASLHDALIAYRKARGSLPSRALVRQAGGRS